MGWFPDPDSAVPRGWVSVLAAPNHMVATMIEGFLKNEGLRVAVQRPGAFVYTGSGGMHTVMVPVEQEAKARELLASIQEPDTEDGEDAEQI